METRIKGVSDCCEWNCYFNGVEIMNLCIECIFTLPILLKTFKTVSQLRFPKTTVT